MDENVKNDQLGDEQLESVGGGVSNETETGDTEKVQSDTEVKSNPQAASPLPVKTDTGALRFW